MAGNGQNANRLGVACPGPLTGMIRLAVAILLAGVAAVALFTPGPGDYLVSSDACTLHGSFSAQGTNSAKAAPQDSRDATEAAFGSWTGTSSHTGRFTSADFRAPRLLNFLVAGYPRQDGISLWLEDAADGRKLALQVLDDPRGSWRRLQWTLPSGWRSRTVRLVVDDQSRAEGAWIGITVPREGGAQSAMSQLARTAGWAGMMAAEGGLFLLPGVVLALLLRRRFALDGVRFTAVVFTGAALSGYVCFWVYFVNVHAGKIASDILLGAPLLAAPLLIRIGWKEANAAAVWREALSASTLVLLSAWFYLGIGYAYTAGVAPGLQAASRLTVKQLPPDHLLPLMLAHHVYYEVPLRPYLLDVWKSSDRPPLQAGAALTQYPFWKLYDEETHYYLLAIFLQSLWAGALWLFLRFAAVPRQSILIVLALCISSGFFFDQSFYVWPKLLAAALFLVGLTFSTFSSPDYRWSGFDAVLSGAAIALGLLSHTGVALAAPGVAWILYRARVLPSRRTIAWGTAAVVLLYLPWVWYQKRYDPPGDLLLKAHIAGIVDQTHSFGQLLRAAYGKLSFGEWLYNKLENVRVLFVQDAFPLLFTGTPRQRYDVFTAGNFYATFQALGLLNLGLLLRWRIRRRKPAPSTPPDVRLADRCLTAALIATAAWCLIMFGPGATIIHQGSLATMMLFFVAAGIYMASLAERLAWAIAGFQMVVLLPIFVFGKFLFGNFPGSLMDGAIDSGFIGLALTALAGLIVWGKLVETPSIDALLAPPAADGRKPSGQSLQRRAEKRTR